METKRIVLAIVLSMLVLLAWNYFIPPQQPRVEQGQQVADQGAEPSATQEEKAGTQDLSKQPIGPSGADMPDYESVAGEKITVETPLYKAVFSSSGGILESFVLKKYKQTIQKGSKNIKLLNPSTLGKAPLGLLWNQKPTWSEAKWTLKGKDLNLRGQESGTLVLHGKMQDVNFVRRFKFQADSYQIKEVLSIQNKSQSTMQGIAGFSMASEGLVDKESRYNKTSIDYFNSNGLEEKSDKDDLRLGIQSAADVNWGGIASNYFLLAVVPTSKKMRLKGKYDQDIYRVALEAQTVVSGGTEQNVQCTYYLGPKKAKNLAKAPNNLTTAIHYGWFDFIAKPLIKVLNFFYDYVGNYGVAIIFLTILIKIVFWPLSQKSYKSMEQMKKLQPMMQKLKEQYKDDRQKMNQELMQLYKTYKVNPAGGCLPMLLQIPVFIALYQALLGAIELRHAPFITYVPFTDIFWLADLSAKDPFYVTPVLMGLSMFLQQKLSPSTGDPTQAKIMMLMPVVLTFVFLSFPAGLVVYWLANNVLSIAQQWWMIRKA
jgi:YidC/Oxa1 family membrane protein insertase